MGCLLEIFFEIFITGILEVTTAVYFKLATVFVPDKTHSEKAKDTVKNIVITASVLLLLVLVFGIIFLLPPYPTLHLIGKYMTFIPLSIIGIQVLLGIIVTVVKIAKNKR
ncbi:MAG: hypothetical protein IJW51_03380 [Clostridia bacterium]|nr:hypothetical protein [Clostridia bacterium]